MRYDFNFLKNNCFLKALLISLESDIEAIIG